MVGSLNLRITPLGSDRVVRLRDGRAMGYAQYGIPGVFDELPAMDRAGAQDQLVNPSWPHRLATRIPNATLNIRDGGHFMAHRYYREIFEALFRQ